jgi:hypothetical protein
VGFKEIFLANGFDPAFGFDATLSFAPVFGFGFDATLSFAPVLSFGFDASLFFFPALNLTAFVMTPFFLPLQKLLRPLRKH